MYPNLKPAHALVYTVPISMEQQFKQSKEIVGLEYVGNLEEYYSSEWAFRIPSFAFPKNNESQESELFQISGSTSYC
jgi:hypothetical protein